jgi:hypothetical protein
MNKGTEGLLIKRREWLTKDRQRIKVEDLEDSHLINILKMLKNAGEVNIKIKQMEMLVIVPPTAEMASYYWDRELENLFSATWEDAYNDEALEVLLSEARARKLDWEDPFFGLRP